jgi:hypothetical protein
MIPLQNRPKSCHLRLGHPIGTLLNLNKSHHLHLVHDLEKQRNSLSPSYHVWIPMQMLPLM